MNLSRYDTIKIKDKEELERLLSWRDNNKDLVRNFNPSLTEGVIEYSNYYQQYFRDKALIVEHKVYMKGELTLHFKWHKLLKTVDLIYILKEGFLNEYPKDEAIKDALTVYASLMAYMEHYREDVKRVKRNTVTNVSKSNKKPKKNRKGKTKVKIGKHYSYNITITKEQSVEKAKKKKRKSPKGSFTVRGHWRHYKSGKTIWIDSFPKGEGRKKVKIYQV